MYSISKKVGLLAVFALMCSGCSSEEQDDVSLQKIGIVSADGHYRVEVLGAFKATFDQVAFRAISPKEIEAEHQHLLKGNGVKRSLIIGNLISHRVNGLIKVEGAIIANRPLDGIQVMFPDKLYPQLRNEKGERIKSVTLSGMLASFQLTELKNGSWNFSGEGSVLDF